jgi:ubiquitin carboxyl-terminal hydrolase 25/28
LLTPCFQRFYAGLGATSDFHDDLILFSYSRQISVDEHGTPYYLECLQGIAEGRKSEALQTHVAIEASNEKISLKDIRHAYQQLGFDPHNWLDEDTIIGTFQSRVSSSPKQEAELRRALKIVGQDRWSDKIQQVAANGKRFSLYHMCRGTSIGDLEKLTSS